MKFVKLASAIGALAAVLFVGCGPAGNPAGNAVRSGGSIETGVTINGLVASQNQYMCMRYDTLWRAPVADAKWTAIPASMSDWICGDLGKETVKGPMSACKYTNGGTGYGWFIDYEIAFCQNAPASPTAAAPCGVGNVPLFRSRAAAKGACPADKSNVYGTATVQFDNKGPWGGGLHPVLSVEEVCWNYKLGLGDNQLADPPIINHPGVTCDQLIGDESACYEFGIEMGPANCVDGKPSDYCVIGAESAGHPFQVVDAQLNWDGPPPLNLLLINQHLLDEWGLAFLAFPPGSLANAGFLVIQAPWLLYVNNTGVPSDWNNLDARITDFNRGAPNAPAGQPASYRTVGSWYYHGGTTNSVGVITAGWPPESLPTNSIPPYFGTTYMIWDDTPVCDVTKPPTNTFDGDGRLLHWANPHNVQKCGAGETSIIKGVVQKAAFTDNGVYRAAPFDILYACIGSGAVDAVTGEIVDPTKITSLWKLACDGGRSYKATDGSTGYPCDCVRGTYPPAWFGSNECTPNFVVDP